MNLFVCVREPLLQAGGLLVQLKGYLLRYDLPYKLVVAPRLTDDGPEMAQRAMRLIDSDTPVIITDAVLAETAHVLRRLYGMSREEIVDLLLDLVRRRNVSVHNLDKAIVATALLLCRPSGRVSIPDALIWSAARCSPPAVIFTFDEQFPIEGMDVRQPG